MRNAVASPRTVPACATACATWKRDTWFPTATSPRWPGECWSSPGTPRSSRDLGRGARRFAERLTWERTAAETERHLLDIIAGAA